MYEDGLKAKSILSASWGGPERVRKMHVYNEREIKGCLSNILEVK